MLSSRQPTSDPLRCSTPLTPRALPLRRPSATSRQARAAAGGSPEPREAAAARGGGVEAEAAPPAAALTLPTVLTLCRVAAVPLLLAVHFVDSPAARTASLAIFLLASLTDWLDGYLARKMKSTSAFGAFLDPVADKLMVAAALILLTAQPPAALSAPLWALAAPATAVIGREITMSALREWAACAGGEAHAAVAVNSLGKWKTATQMAGITALFAADPWAAALGAAAAGQLALTGLALVWASAGLALLSLGVYMRALLPILLR